VAKGSPAEAVGLKEGDIIIAIDRNFSQNIQQYKLAIQNSGDKLKILIQRGTDILEYNVKVKSIL
jgi:predicted metalloprotease with PDZ domain